MTGATSTSQIPPTTSEPENGPRGGFTVVLRLAHFVTMMATLLSVVSCHRPQVRQSSGTISGFGSENAVYACAGTACVKYMDETQETWGFKTSKPRPSEFLVVMNSRDSDERVELSVVASKASDSWCMTWRITGKGGSATVIAKTCERLENVLRSSQR